MIEINKKDVKIKAFGDMCIHARNGVYQFSAEDVISIINAQSSRIDALQEHVRRLMIENSQLRPRKNFIIPTGNTHGGGYGD